MREDRNVTIITGASQGIGAGLLRAFHDRGDRVVATSRSIEASNDPDILTVRGDIADAATAERIVTTAVERFGRIDSLINNAGVFISKPFAEFTCEDYAAVTATNLSGFFHLTQRAAAQMLKQASGHIVNMTTSLADQPIAGVPAALNSLTKGGLNAVTRSLAIEYAATGIRVNAVSPGIIKTPMHNPAQHDFLATLHPMQRMGEVQEIIDAVMYLESAAFVSGEVLHVDGGAHAGRW